MNTTKQYGVKYPGMAEVTTSASKSHAQAAVDRAQKMPCTKGAVMMEREVQVTDWARSE